MNKRIGFFGLLLVLIFLVGCFDKSIVGSKEVVTEITRLEGVALDRNLTKDDISKLSDLVKNDAHASDHIEEMNWLFDHGEIEHASHGLGSILEYVQTGETSECIVHVLEHVRLYHQYADAQRLNAALGELDVDAWITKSESLRAKFPQ